MPINEPAKRVEELEPGVWLYSDGLKRYHGYPGKHNGSIAPGNPKPEWLKDFTPETSKLALKNRGAKHLKAQEAIELELMKKLKTKSGPLAIAKMAGVLASGVMSDNHPLQARSATFKTIASAGGYTQERSGATQATQVNITLGVEAAEALRGWGVDVIEVEEIGDSKL